ncbi:MAG: mercuric reductase [Gemmatimonadota bacterium]|nr:mercuric reductase [Gemmatimonadota bacterium]
MDGIAAAGDGAAQPLDPWDEHNRRLVAEVHPPEWVNPSPRGSYHLVVVGAGTGGLVTAAIAAGLGARVALVERSLMGGDCLNVGCVPSKAMLRAARAWADARDAQGRFGGPAAEGEGDFGSAMEGMRRVRAEIAHVDGAERFRGLGVDVFFGEARFTATDAVDVGGEQLHFRRAVIATGSRPTVPPITGLQESGYLTNETVFSLTRLPERLVVLGGGPIGCELAQCFARFGSRVTLLERDDRLLAHDDADAARIVEEALRADGVEVWLGAEVEGAGRSGEETTVRFRRGGAAGSVACDELLAAVGRAPNVEDLGLEAADVRFGKGGVEVDERLRTSNASIFAVGDVCTRYRFTHMADAHARLVVRNALFYGRGRVDRLVVPWCTYTSPELAHVGISADTVRERGEKIQTLTLPFAEVDRARLEGDGDGFLRIHLERGSDTILGATLVGEHAGEIISQITQAMVAGVGLEKLGEVIFPYPTRADIVRRAADRYRRGKLTSTVEGVLAAYFRLVR